MSRSVTRSVVWGVVVLGAVNAATWMAVAALGARHVGAPVAPSELVAGYVAYLRGVLGGNLGALPGAVGEPVTQLLRQTIPRSLVLLGLALPLAAAAGLTVGFSSVDRARTRTNDRALALSILGYAAPAFYVGILAIVVLLRSNPWLGRTGQPTLLPAAGYGLDQHLVLPVLALALRPAADVARLTSTLLAEELPSDYVRAGWAKGLSWTRLRSRYLFRNIAPQVLLTLGNAMRYLVGSLVVVEVLFGWGGVGKAVASAIAPRTDGRSPDAVLYEPAVAAALITALAFLLVVVTLVTRLGAQALDPRLREEAAR